MDSELLIAIQPKLETTQLFLVFHRQNLSPQYIQGYQKGVEGQSIHGLRLVQPFESLLTQ